MNQKKLFLTLMAIFCLCSLSTAETGQKTKRPNKAPITLVKTNRDASSDRPKAPDRQIVTCMYDGNQLLLSFTISEGMSSLSVTDDSLLTKYFEFDSFPLEISLPIVGLNGSVYLELDTEKGNHFVGVID